MLMWNGEHVNEKLILNFADYPIVDLYHLCGTIYHSTFHETYPLKVLGHPCSQNLNFKNRALHFDFHFVCAQ